MEIGESFNIDLDQPKNKSLDPLGLFMTSKINKKRLLGSFPSKFMGEVGGRIVKTKSIMIKRGGDTPPKRSKNVIKTYLYDGEPYSSSVDKYCITKGSSRLSYERKAS